MLATAHESGYSPAFEGLYETIEAAKYLRATQHADVIYPTSSTKLIRWIRRGFASSDLTEVHGRDLLIGFEDLVSMRVIVALRAVGVSWHEIHETNRWLRDHLGVPRPFATEFLWVGQGQIFAEWSESLIAASRYGQVALDILREYVIPVHGLIFDSESQVAVSWEPSEGVMLKPQVQFGEPCIRGTRIPTRTVWGMIEAGDSAEWVAQAYSLSEEEVQAACAWESLLESN